MKKVKHQNQVKLRRKVRAGVKLSGTAQKPRLSVFRSLEHIYAQLIDDERAVTLVSAKDTEVKGGKKKLDRAGEVGRLLAEKALAKKINQAVFDRGSAKYHGRVKALAEGAREGGLKI